MWLMLRWLFGKKIKDGKVHLKMKRSTFDFRNVWVLLPVSITSQNGSVDLVLRIFLGMFAGISADWLVGGRMAKACLRSGAVGFNRFGAFAFDLYV